MLRLIKEINFERGTNIQYLAELDAFHIFGAGETVAKYINQFSSESVKAYLVPQLILDRVKDCDKLILQLYLQYQRSNEYISPPGKPAPAHIYVRYDNAFRTLKSQRIANELLSIVVQPRNAFYLPLTVGMLAKWKIPELKKLLLLYSAPDSISFQDLGMVEGIHTYLPSYSYICKELRFLAINGLKYYPSEDTLNAIQTYTSDADSDIRSAAKKVMKKFIL